jgi:DNA invertase Pin-like site-specific DNA recombinase
MAAHPPRKNKKKCKKSKAQQPKRTNEQVMELFVQNGASETARRLNISRSQVSRIVAKIKKSQSIFVSIYQTQIVNTIKYFQYVAIHQDNNLV